MATEPRPAAAETLNAPDERAAAAARAAATVPDDEKKYGLEHCCVRQFWAVVETNGTLVRGRNVAWCKKIGVGIYEVYFTGDVSNGVFNATIGRPGYATAPHGEITVALRWGPGPYTPQFTAPGANTKGVWVQTWDSTGNPADREFHLTVLTQ
jgi:hypothetical protein